MTKTINPRGTGEAPPVLNKHTAETPLNSGITPKIGAYTSPGVQTRPPAAAVFNQGATHLAQIKDAVDQRREHSRQLSERGAPFNARPTATRDATKNP